MLRSNSLTLTGRSVILVLFASMIFPAAADEPVAANGPTTDERSPDELRGAITPERAWWDLRHYRLEVRVDVEKRSLEGTNTIRFRVLQPGDRMQIDLQQPMEIRSIDFDGAALLFEREGNVCWVEFPAPLEVGADHEIVVAYGGTPTESANPPWSGGLSWKRDENGKPFVVTTCQGIGASIWWPNKDHGYDEPDDGMEMHYTVPADLVAIGNGRLFETTEPAEDGTRTYRWLVTQPINNYCVNLNLGDYVRFGDTFEGEAGTLDLEYWVLRDHLEVAREHFREAPRTLAAFEHWFGPYPFYEDGYKLVEVPYPGMEHQSSVTYGNGFRNGYGGRDLSGTGVGFLFDFIIVHESGHEWFGNNVSMKDAADMWIHEGFTNYSENLFVEYHFSEKQAQDYVIGCRRLIRNDRPIIGTYDRNESGSGDMYYKGGNLLHTLRHLLNDDATWRSILRGMNETYRHRTVTTVEIEGYLSERTGLDLKAFFEQYLRTTDVPQLTYSIDGNTLRYRWENVVEGFAMPIDVTIDGTERRIAPTESWQELKLEMPIESFEVDRNFYVTAESAEASE
ncbi:MAG TPA: M1 family metallopeptidase [Pirellulaceae bacterium]|nr:M1 family metallopeptidase [Pirellulaceae bacterium]